MTKIDFIKKEDRYFLKINYMESFIGMISNGDVIMYKINDKKLYDDLINKIKNIYIFYNESYFPASHTDNILFYSLPTSTIDILDNNIINQELIFIKIEVDKKDFTKLKLRYS